MKPPANPEDETSRLGQLQSLQILDSPTEERFDRLTRLARRMFNVPIALVSLVDENRQWFKSCMGLGARETPRDISFCGHAILGDGVFLIPNASEDERFADNPLVVGNPSIRFYAGCPLRVNGYKLGTLCIIDSKPRHLAEEDIEALRDLAAMVEHELAAVEMATLDPLTQISNRRGFLLLAQHSLSLCARQQVPASLVFLDLDRFKSINDRFGHDEGDRVLVCFAEQMKKVFRESDLYARLGGDEFVILLANATRSVAEELIGRFARSLAEFNEQAQRGYDIAFSSGITECLPGQHQTVVELLANSDALMYESKRGKAGPRPQG